MIPSPLGGGFRMDVEGLADISNVKMVWVHTILTLLWVPYVSYLGDDVVCC
jgi:hypothetical protein